MPPAALAASDAHSLSPSTAGQAICCVSTSGDSAAIGNALHPSYPTAARDER
jgi:hypothetical protein